jgi:hypothetical protein
MASRSPKSSSSAPGRRRCGGCGARRVSRLP